MIKIHCIICGRELNEPGALLFSPPDITGVCIKSHICKDCYESYFEPIVMNPAKKKGESSDSNIFEKALKKLGKFFEYVGRKVLNPHD